MYPRQVPRAADPTVRLRLIENAAAMLAAREPVTLRSLVQRCGASTMAVYTHFGGMEGLWRAVRQEGFTRLARRLDGVEATADPVHDLAALGAAYLGNALDHPALYRVMFDAAADLEDPAAADQAFQTLVSGAERARAAGRVLAATDPQQLATEYWAAGHGLAMLVLSSVLPGEAVAVHGPALAVGLLVGAGDDRERCEASVRSAWSVTSAGAAPGGP
jgi:AcrR family transcriptional regulator